MYLKLENDSACFYNLSAPNQKEFEFKFKPYCCPGFFESLCFEAVITSKIRSFFEKYDVEIDEFEAKLYFALEPDGSIG